MAYFRASLAQSGADITITVSYDSTFYNKTITCTKGSTTYTKTTTSSGSTEFSVSEAGAWTITCNGASVSVDVILNYVTEFAPDGSTVTPTDDIQTWLHCASIWDKSYTTLAEVLADSTTLLALMSDNNAVDYLVRSKSWSGGANVGLVPVLSGTSVNVLCDSEGSGNEAWRAYDNGGSTFWASTRTSGAWIGYDFGHPVHISKIDLTQAYSLRATKIKIQASSDKSTWVDMSNELSLTKYDQNETVSFTPLSNNSYRYWRMYIVTASTTVALVALQFYAKSGVTDNSTAMTDIGANNYCANTLLADSTWCAAICNSQYFESVLNVKVPTMTSDTTPSGQVFYTTKDQGNPYTAFTNLTGNNDGWAPSRNNTASIETHIGYRFTSALVCKKWTFENGIYGYGGAKIYLQGSNDGTTYHDLSSEITIPTTVQTIASGVLASNTTSYQYYRLSNKASSLWTFASGWLRKINFYGRRDV